MLCLRETFVNKISFSSDEDLEFFLHVDPAVAFEELMDNVFLGYY